jgi:hypothetical protein
MTRKEKVQKEMDKFDKWCDKQPNLCKFTSCRLCIKQRLSEIIVKEREKVKK